MITCRDYQNKESIPVLTIAFGFVTILQQARDTGQAWALYENNELIAIARPDGSSKVVSARFSRILQ